MSSQELVKYLRYGSGAAPTNGSMDNPVIDSLVSCPVITIRPKAIPHARRICVFNRKVGRYVDITYKDGSHRYIIQADGSRFSVDAVASLTHKVTGIFGHCHVEQNYLIIYIPTGYYLKMLGDSIVRAELVIDLNEDLANV